jgi:cathepsin L
MAFVSGTFLSLCTTSQQTDMTFMKILTFILFLVSCSCSWGMGHGAHKTDGDTGWKFSGLASKAAARAKARADTEFASLGRDDFENAETETQDNDGDDPNSPPRNRGDKKLKRMFADWTNEFAFSYPSPDARRDAFKNFKANMARVQALNLDATTEFWGSGNEFSGLSTAQFASRYLMTRFLPIDMPVGAGAGAGAGRRTRMLAQAQAQAPARVNWVQAKKVTPIKHQGNCGACWAFAATAVIESMYLIHADADANMLNMDIDLSEQQLISCANREAGYRSSGCTSGYADAAIRYVIARNQTTEARYPYTGRTGVCNDTLVKTSPRTRHVQLSGKVTQVTNSAMAPAVAEKKLMLAVANAPVVVYFSVDGFFQIYAGGVYKASNCSSAINHAMVIVGYNIAIASDSDALDGRFWNVRNSWGKTWGEQGYARVKMTGTGNGPCGMYRYTYAAPAPASVRVGTIAIAIARP